MYFFFLAEQLMLNYFTLFVMAGVCTGATSHTTSVIRPDSDVIAVWENVVSNTKVNHNLGK